MCDISGALLLPRARRETGFRLYQRPYPERVGKSLDTSPTPICKAEAGSKRLPGQLRSSRQPDHKSVVPRRGQRKNAARYAAADLWTPRWTQWRASKRAAGGMGSKPPVNMRPWSLDRPKAWWANPFFHAKPMCEAGAKQNSSKWRTGTNKSGWERAHYSVDLMHGVVRASAAGPMHICGFGLQRFKIELPPASPSQSKSAPEQVSGPEPGSPFRRE